MSNLRLALRRVRQTPGFTFTAILTLALGIGASSAIFSVVEAYLLRPLPYSDPGALVHVQAEQPGLGRANLGVSVPEFEELRARSDVFAELSIVFPMHGNLTGVAQPQRVEAVAVSPNFFRLLGVSAAHGRTFGPEEEKATGWAEGCVLSHAAWQRHFGGDPAVLERKIRLDYDTYRIIGVMPPDFRHPGRTLSSEVDVWFTGGLRTAPFPAQPQRARRNIPALIGRLRSGLTPVAAQAAIDAHAASVRQQFPNDYTAESRWRPRLTPLQQQLVGDTGRLLWLLFGAVALVLLVCCATLANLLLVRAANRRSELAVRLALGASRAALVRQLCAESMLLALIGGAAGLALAWMLPPVVLALAPAGLPQVNAVEINRAVLAFTLGISLATGLLFGLAPAAQATRFDLVTSLKAGGRGAGTSRGTQRLRALFSAAQIALSLVLLAGGGLLLRSFVHALRVNPGFDAARVTIARLWLPPPTDPNARQTYRNAAHRVTFMREVLRRVRALPGVKSAALGLGQSVPLAGDWSTTSFQIEGAKEPTATGTALLSMVTPDYFAALGIRLLRGRVFAESDEGEARVAIVSAAMVARYWPDGDAIGRRISLGGPAPQGWTIVGIVNDVKTEGLDANGAPHLYVPAYQRSGMGVTAFVRVAQGAMPPSAELLRGEIRAIDPDLPVFGVLPLEDIAARSLASRRFVVVMVGAFAVVALGLAALGLYGVVACSVAQRTAEFGVRMALGAGRADVFRLVMRQALRLTAFGVLIGLVAAAALARTLRGLLFATSALDLWTFVGVVVLLAAVALLASWLPARRAMRIEPAVALRGE
jgi:putative ABC transport system permease protein